LFAIEYKGQSPVSDLVKGDKIHVKGLLNILKPADVPIIRCIGLNYIAHSKWSVTECAVRLLRPLQSKKEVERHLLTLPCSSNPQRQSRAFRRMFLFQR
jgi:hypothetical protein